MSGYPQEFPESRRKRSRWGGRGVMGVALSIILLIAVVFIFDGLYLVLFAPWAISVNGGPTLTGTWVGPLRSKWGSEYHLFLDLQWNPPPARASRGSPGRSRADLVGEARVCNRTGKVFQLSVTGDANRDASDVRVYVEARESQYRESLPLRGTWHGETLQLASFTTIFGPEGELRGGRSTVSSTTTDAAGRLVELYPSGLTPEQVPADSFPDMTLRKGGEAEFRAGCDSLRG